MHEGYIYYVDCYSYQYNYLCTIYSISITEQYYITMTTNFTTSYITAAINLTFCRLLVRSVFTMVYLETHCMAHKVKYIIFKIP